MHIPLDTSTDVEQAQRQLLRDMSPADRVAIALRLSSDVIHSSKRAIARTHPGLKAREVEHLFIELHYGKELADAVRQRDKARDDDRSQ